MGTSRHGINRLGAGNVSAGIMRLGVYLVPSTLIGPTKKTTMAEDTTHSLDIISCLITTIVSNRMPVCKWFKEFRYQKP